MTDARTCADCPADISGRHAYALRCPPCAKEANREAARRRYWGDPERGRKNARLWEAANADRYSGQHRRWRMANQERHRKSARVRYWEDPEKHRELKRRRAKPRRWLPAAIAHQGGICTWCDLPLPDDLSLIEADHIHPVSKGGETSPENTAALHTACNRSKGARVAA